MNLEQIDTSTTAGKAEVMRLAAEGRRVVAFLPTQPTAKWGEVEDPVWDWHRTRYAIISEPVGPEEVWVVVAGDHLAAGPFKDEQTAIDCSESFRNISNQVVRYIRADLAGEKG